MLKRRLSSDLRRALMGAYDVPNEYHAFVGYLRELDAEIQSVRASSRHNSTPHNQITRGVPEARRGFSQPELTVSQGGTAMDLDIVSRSKDANGHLTPQAKDARRKSGRCIRCNQSGHIVRYCPLGSQANSIASTEIALTEESSELKD